MSETRPTLSGPKILLMGPSGTGKTRALGTIGDWAAANGHELFVLFTERGEETFLGYWKDRDLPIPECIHWRSFMTKSLGFAQLISAAEQAGKFNYEALTKLQDPNRSQNNAFHDLLKECANFRDDRTGKEFGGVDSWDSKRIFAIDSLTETANAAMKMQIGNKPTAAPPDYMVAQNNLMNFLRLLTQGTRCTFVMTAHIDRQTDELSQTTKLMVKSIGKALASDIPPLFSDVIMTVREADKFYWDTAMFGADTKTRSLGYRSKINPDFAQVMDVWLKRSKQ